MLSVEWRLLTLTPHPGPGPGPGRTKPNRKLVFVTFTERQLCHNNLLNTITKSNIFQLYRVHISKKRRESKMSVESREREVEVMGVSARERVLGDQYLLDTIFSYLDPSSLKTVRRVSR